MLSYECGSCRGVLGECVACLGARPRMVHLRPHKYHWRACLPGGAWPSVDRELIHVRTKAVEELGLEWSAPKGRLDEWFLPGSHQKITHQRTAPFFPEVHYELTKKLGPRPLFCLHCPHCCWWCRAKGLWEALPSRRGASARPQFWDGKPRLSIHPSPAEPPQPERVGPTHRRNRSRRDLSGEKRRGLSPAEARPPSKKSRVCLPTPHLVLGIESFIHTVNTGPVPPTLHSPK